MSKGYNLEIITLAGAILQTRGSADISDIEKALEDAKWTINPLATNEDYKKWQSSNDIKPTTKEEDQEMYRKQAEGMRTLAQSLQRNR